MKVVKFEAGEYYVVKCGCTYAKSFWGRVVFCACDKDNEYIVGGDDKPYRKDYLFPLPTQGDKVEVSHNGNDFINIREYRALADSIFICKNEHGKYEVWQYIRPIEVKEEDNCICSIDFDEKTNIKVMGKPTDTIYLYINGELYAQTDES